MRFNKLDFEIMLYDFFDNYKDSVERLEDKGEYLKDVIDMVIENIVDEEGLEE